MSSPRSLDSTLPISAGSKEIFELIPGSFLDFPTMFAMTRLKRSSEAFGSRL